MRKASTIFAWRGVGAGEQGFTLVEMMVALTILAMTIVGMMSAFTLLNRFAWNSRNQSSAKALCQQRIEQALALPFHPPAILSSIDGFYLLGQAANWTTAAAPYTLGSPASFTGGAGGVQTSTENVSVYVEQNGTTVTVPGVRTTTVACSDTTLDLAQFTVQVAYTYRGKSYSYSMFTLRSPD